MYFYIDMIYTLPKTNSSPLKMDGWKMKCSIAKAYIQEIC